MMGLTVKIFSIIGAFINLANRNHSTYICTEFGFRVISGLKGKPVQFRRYPRSCKERELAMGNGEIHTVFTIRHTPFTLLNLHTTVALSTGRCSTEAKPEDLPGITFNHSRLSGERHGV